MRKKSVAFLLTAAITLITLPASVAASVMSELYTVEGNEISEVYPETFVCDFKANIVSEESIKLYRGEDEIYSGYVEGGDILKAGSEEYTVSLKDTVVFDPMEKIKNIADGTVLYNKPVGTDFSVSALANYGFFWAASTKIANYKNKNFNVVKESENGIPVFEISTDCATPLYFRGDRLADYTADSGKYIVFEAEILSDGNGGSGISYYLYGNKGNKFLTTYISSTENPTFLINENSYGIGGTNASIVPTNNLGSFNDNESVRVKTYYKINQKAASVLEMAELCVGGEKKAGPVVFSALAGTTIDYLQEFLIGLWANTDDNETTVRFSNIKAYITDSCPSIGTKAEAAVKDGSGYEMSGDTVSGVPAGETVKAFIENIIVSDKAGAIVIDEFGNEVPESSAVNETMKLKVFSADGKNENIYSIKISNDSPRIKALISGETTVGSYITASYEALEAEYEGCDVSYRWFVSDSVGGTFEEIEGETENTLLLSAEYKEKYIKVGITPYISGNPMKEAVSAAVGAVTDKAEEITELINSSTAATAEAKMTAAAEKSEELKNIKDTLSDYYFRLACLDMLKGIPYSGYDDICRAFSKAAGDVLEAANGEINVKLEPYDIGTNNMVVLEGSTEVTRDEYIFKYDGKGFIVVDSDEDNLYVLARDYYGTAMADTTPTTGFNAESETNLGYFLNHNFITAGNGGVVLPENIIKYIDYSRAWYTEPALRDKSTTKTCGGIGLLSITEYLDNIGIIGVDSDIGASLYWLRSPSGVNNEQQLGLSMQYKGAPIVAKPNDKVRYVRPSFWLDKSFFENNKITEAGSNVALKIADICDIEKLKEIYSENELNELFPKPYISEAFVKGIPYEGNTLTVSYKYPEDFIFEEGDTLIEWFYADKKNGTYISSGVTGREFNITADYIGKYLKAVITPRSVSAVNTDGDTVTVSVNAAVISKSDADNMAVTLCSENGEAFEDYFFDNGSIFMADKSMDSLTDEEFDYALELLEKSDFDSIEAYEEDLKTCILMAKVKSAAAEDVETVIAENESGMNVEAYMGLADKTAVNEYIKAGEFESADDFVKKVDEKVALEYFKAATRADITKILDMYDNMLDSDISKLTKAQKKTLGYSLLNYNFNSLNDVNEAVKALYPSNPGEDDNGGSGSGGGKSGQGGGSGGTIVSSASANIPASQQKTALFDDMAGYEWAVTAVDSLARKGIINGMGGKKFAPGENLTREQLAKIVSIAFGLKSSGKGTPFKDVKAGEWYSDYIAAAYENGAVIGLSEDNFGVGEYVTREQLAVIIYRILLRKGIVFKKDETSLSDVESISDYAKEAVLAMEASSIIMGYDDGSFKPYAKASRAAAAAIIYRAINVAEVTA